VTRVLVLYTGGTIGMVPRDPDDDASPLVPAGLERLVRFIPNPLHGISWDIRGLADDDGNPVGPLDSSSIGPRHWCQMARAIGEGYESHGGVVVLHGTDTMAYTGSALSFLLENLAKPVILTGSQSPIFAEPTDAVANFRNALAIAGYGATGLPCVPEVAICFGDVLLRANRATKVSTTALRAFESPNCPPLGRLGDRIEIDPAGVLPPPGEAFRTRAMLRDNVALISLYPGMTGDALGRFLGLDGVDGYVLRCFGSGNAPEDGAVTGAVAQAIAAGKVVVCVSQCLEGRVEMGRYGAGSGLMRAGAIDGLDLTDEAALTKLMWLLATGSVETARARMQANLRGELSAA
jgi:L-asparaginase